MGSNSWLTISAFYAKQGKKFLKNSFFVFSDRLFHSV